MGTILNSAGDMVDLIFTYSLPNQFAFMFSFQFSIPYRFTALCQLISLPLFSLPSTWYFGCLTRDLILFFFNKITDLRQLYTKKNVFLPVSLQTCNNLSHHIVKCHFNRTFCMNECLLNLLLCFCLIPLWTVWLPPHTFLTSLTLVGLLQFRFYTHLHDGWTELVQDRSSFSKT